MSYFGSPGFGIQSTVNSSTSTLGSSATFTGTSELNSFPDVMTSCYADVAGTLYFDFSVNGTDWRTFPTSGYAVSAGIHEFHTAVKGPRYFRVRYVNGASAQSTFQLYVYYGTYRQPSAPLNQPLGLDADATVSRTPPYWLDLTRGLYSDIRYTKKFGRNDSVGTSFVPVCFGGNYQTPQSGSATTLRIKSGGNANDDASGTGAREVTIVGLDENFEAAMEAVATAGASASSATTTTFTRVHRAYVSKSGTYATQSAASSAGDIVIENGSGGTDWVTLDSTGFPKSQSEIAAYTIEAGYTGYVFISNLSVDSGKTVDMVFFARSGCDETAAPYSAMQAKSVITGITQGSTQFPNVNAPLGPFTGPADIGFLAKVGTGTGSVSAEFEIFEVKE